MPQSFVSLRYHVIFSTKNRAPFLDKETQPRLFAYIGGILAENDSRLLAAGGMPDHVHLLVALNKQLAVADALRLIKTNSSKWLRANGENFRRFAWQSGYAAFTVSQSKLVTVTNYIGTQERHHKKQSFEEELIEFLQRHEIEYDKKYLFD